MKPRIRVTPAGCYIVRKVRFPAFRITDWRGSRTLWEAYVDDRLVGPFPTVEIAGCVALMRE
jgi:hypothetical protein